jgi:hypothetical protein
LNNRTVAGQRNFPAQTGPTHGSDFAEWLRRSMSFPFSFSQRQQMKEIQVGAVANEHQIQMKEEFT